MKCDDEPEHVLNCTFSSALADFRIEFMQYSVIKLKRVSRFGLGKTSVALGPAPRNRAQLDRRRE